MCYNGSLGQGILIFFDQSELFRWGQTSHCARDRKGNPRKWRHLSMTRNISQRLNIEKIVLTFMVTAQLRTTDDKAADFSPKLSNKPIKPFLWHAANNIQLNLLTCLGGGWLEDQMKLRSGLGNLRFDLADYGRVQVKQWSHQHSLVMLYPVEVIFNLPSSVQSRELHDCWTVAIIKSTN